MQESKPGRGRTPAPAGRPDWLGRRVYPCSSAQAHLVFEEQLQPGSPARNVFARWRLEGEVAGSDLQDAWRTLVARHESLRTRFSEADGTPVQIVEPHLDFHIREIDLTLLKGDESAREAERIAGLEAQTPFALEAAPLIRVTHVRQRPGASVLMVTAHHAVCDGWSMGILAREMGELCAAKFENRAPRLDDLTLTYGDHATRQREWLAANSFEPERAQLAATLAGYKQFELLPDKPRPAQPTWQGDIASVLLDTELTNRLSLLAREQACTLFTVAYATLSALLHRESGETDIALGTQVAGRDEVALEPMVGTFVNTLVLRTDLSGDPAFLELLQRARDTIADAFEIRHVPIATVVQVVNPKRDPSRNPLLSVNFVFQRSFVPNRRYGSFSLVDLPSRSAGALYDLCFFMVERPEGWRLSCEYNVALYETRTATDLVERFAQLLRMIAADPALRLSALPPPTDSRRTHSLPPAPVNALPAESVSALPSAPVSSLPSSPAGSLPFAPIASYTGSSEPSTLTPTEWEMRGFVAALLGHGGFDCNDDIFAFGFHSLLALRLVSRVKHFYGVDLLLRAIVETPTVTALAAQIDAMRSTLPAEAAPDTSATSEPIITLNPAGPLPPLAFLHSDLFADGLYCRRLAAALGPAQPIHSVAPHGTAGLPLPGSVEAMALDYLPRLRAIQPEGPYRIGGFCASGLVAYELARLLRAQGQVVDRVVLINASPLPSRSVAPFDYLLRALGRNQRLGPKLRTALCYNIARLHAAVTRGPLATLRLVIERLSALAKRRGSGTDIVATPQPFVKQRGELRTENSFAHIVAAFTYHPKPYGGDVALIWGSDQVVTADVPRKAWSALSNRVRVIPMAGGHVEALSEHVEDLARAVESALR